MDPPVGYELIAINRAAMIVEEQRPFILLISSRYFSRVQSRVLFVLSDRARESRPSISSFMKVVINERPLVIMVIATCLSSMRYTSDRTGEVLIHPRQREGLRVLIGCYKGHTISREA